MKKRRYLMVKRISVIVSGLLLAVSILLCGQVRVMLSDQRKMEREVLFESSYFQQRKTEQLFMQEIRGVRGVHKQSEVLNDEVQPRNRLPVFLLFLLLTGMIWECRPKCQWLVHTEFRKKACIYSRVSKRRGPPIAAAFC